MPAGGPYARHLQPEWTWEFISSLLTHAILPMLSNIIVIGAGFTLGMRALMISVLGEDYLTFARAKGLSPFTVLKDYAFRNALIPQVTALAIIVGATLNGTFIIEVLFSTTGARHVIRPGYGLCAISIRCKPSCSVLHLRRTHADTDRRSGAASA